MIKYQGGLCRNIQITPANSPKETLLLDLKKGNLLSFYGTQVLGKGKTVRV